VSITKAAYNDVIAHFLLVWIFSLQAPHLNIYSLLLDTWEDITIRYFRASNVYLVFHP